VAAEHDQFRELELINAEIDIFIDEERYKEAEDSLDLSENTKKEIAECFKHDCSQRMNTAWRNALEIKGDKWPVIKAGGFLLSDAQGQVDHKEPLPLSAEIRQGWSALFWAKLLRAKIQERNTDCYLSRLDDVVGALERNLPAEPIEPIDEKYRLEFKLYFYYLMELSAASFDYGSIGYATRARRLLNRNFPSSKTEEGNHLFIDSAKRWIALNEGISYLHLGEYQKASLEFNDIIYTYQNYSCPEKGAITYYLGPYEQQLLYYPSILHRATILLKQQFSYHAVETLNTIPNFEEWSFYKKTRKDLLLAQAYRQMERREKSAEVLINLGDRLFQFQGYKFPEVLNDNNNPNIPDKNKFDQSVERPEALCTRYVELAVNEFLEIIKGVGFPADNDRSIFRLWVEGKEGKMVSNSFGVIESGLKHLIDMYVVLDDFRAWVENNDMDRAGYYRQMAELLAWSARVIDRLKKGEKSYNKEISSPDYDQTGQQNNIVKFQKLTMVLENKLKIYTSDIVDNIADHEKDGNFKGSQCFYCSDKMKIRLTHLRGEDYLSFISDIVSILGAKEADKWFTKLDVLKEKIAEAVAKKESTKGYDLHIERLNLRNKLALFRAAHNCRWCMDGLTHKKYGENFQHLTPCRPIGNKLKQHGRPMWRSMRRLFNQSKTIDSTEEGGQLSGLDYDQIMETHENHFRRHLSKPTKHDSPSRYLKNSNFPVKSVVHFFGLRRWNSISPAEGRSSGGGYLLFRTDEGVIDLGVAIDPGFDFIKNLFHCGFSLVDIDVILLSHSHPDHVRDFESMVNLLKELDDRTGQFKKVNVLLTLGTYVRLQHVFDNKAFRRHVEPLVIDIERDIDRKYFESLGAESSTCFTFIRGNVPGNGRGEWLISLGNQANDERLTIWPTRAYHDDYSGTSDSFGFILDIPVESNEKRTLRFGYTGDTKWVGQSLYPNEASGYRPSGISQQYVDCDVLLIHLGSLIDHKNKQLFSDSSKKWKERCEGIVRGKNHPYLPGLIGFLNEVYNSTKTKAGLILLSEFGEELRGTIRTDLVKRLNRVYESRNRFKPWCYILPVDVGLDVICQPTAYSEPDDEQNDNGRFEFWCAQCKRFHPVENIAYRHYGQDEAIFYLCRTCDKTTSPDVLQDRLRYLYEVGRTLRTDDKESDPRT